MSEDLLKAATRALREQSAEGDADGRFTRARVMASLHQGKVRRRTRLAFILPIAACLAAGTAWGAATGRLPAVFHAVGQLVGYSSRSSQTGPANQPQSSAASAAVARPAPQPVDAAPASPSSDAVPELAPSMAPAPVDARPAPVEPPASAKPAATPSASAALVDADSELYRSAHEAHFTAHDYARALAGWNAYLQAAPRGRLVTEARYNRAICLLRLGRDAEARQALEPFASGQLGYRQTEARELLEELSR